MVVISVSNCPLQLRGDLTKWLQEIDVGVYVGRLSARVRGKIWERICDNIKSGKAIMVYSTNNEQGYTILTHNTECQPKDYDGLSIMFKPEKHSNENVLKRGFSKAAKYEMAKHRKALEEKNENKKPAYIIMDVETTGLDCSHDSIIEVGLLKIENDEIVQEYQSFVKADRDIPEKITELTGITKNVIDESGKDEEQVLNDIRAIICDYTVIGYNVQFDINFINKLCKKHNIPLFIKRSRDILKIARCKLELDNYKLETVCKYYGLEINKVHRALNDCILVYCILRELNKMT